MGAKVLIDVKAGGDHIGANLTPIKLDGEAPIEISDETVEEVLSQCELKLSKLLSMTTMMTTKTTLMRTCGTANTSSTTPSRSWRSNRRSTARKERSRLRSSCLSCRIFPLLRHQCTRGARAQRERCIGRSSVLSWAASVFAALFHRGRCPSATPRFQFAPVASSNSSRTAKLHSFILLVGPRSVFSTVKSDSFFFPFRVVSNIF